MCALKGYYDLNSIIDSGAFSSHKVLSSRNLNKSVILKKIRYGRLNSDQLKQLEEEVNILSKTVHPNIVSVVDTAWDKISNTILVRTDVSSGQDLDKVIEQRRKSGILLEENYVWKALVHVCKGLIWIHSALPKFYLIHQDIRPSNIFIDDIGNFKLANFGFVSRWSKTETFNKGVPYYSPPELLFGKELTKKSDIWALGCFIYEMCCLVQPFFGLNFCSEQNIKLGRLNAPIPDCYSNDLWEVIRFMLIVKPEHRPTIEMVLYHPLVFLNFHVFDVRKGLVKEAKRHNIMEKVPDPFNEIIQNVQNISISQKEPEEISDAVFRQKWRNCLEELKEKENILKEKEAQLKDKEDALHFREQALNHKEKYLRSFRKKIQEKIMSLEFSRRKRKGKLSESFFDNVTDISGDLGEPEGLSSTSTKLDPKLIPRPKFNTKNTPLIRRVHFQVEQKEISSSTGGSSGTLNKSQGTKEDKQNKKNNILRDHNQSNIPINSRHIRY